MLMTANISPQDPTHTIGLRTRWRIDMSRRFRVIMRMIRKRIVEDNFLDPDIITVNIVTNKKKFVYRRSNDKLTEMMRWLLQGIEENILEVEFAPGTAPVGRNMRPWTDAYVHSAYRKGLERNRMDLRARGVDIPETGTPFGTRPITAGLSQPIHIETLELIYTRVFSDLKGITEAMSQQMSRVLARGMVDGLSPDSIARNMVDRVDKIGLTRAKLLVRTETVNAFNTARLNDIELAENFAEDDLLVQWITARDERVRDRHRARHNKIYTVEEARSMIGEPNCRCTTVVWIPSVDGEVNDSNRGRVN
jgi:SPP1 gp7 family putative phage head morphogenesis protein